MAKKLDQSHSNVNPFQPSFLSEPIFSGAPIPGNGLHRSINGDALHQTVGLSQFADAAENDDALKPSQDCPEGLQYGGKNFYSVEFAEKLRLSLPFIKSEPKQRFLNDWKTDNEILPKLGLTLNVQVKQEPADQHGQEVRHINDEVRTCRPEQGLNERHESAKTVRIPQSRKWRCLVCERILSNFESLRRHFKLLHPGKNPRIESSPVDEIDKKEGDIYNQAGNEDSSENRKRKMQLFKCEYCSKISTRSHDLKRHVQRMHFVCTDCSTAFSNQSEVFQHLSECSKICRYKRLSLPNQTGENVDLSKTDQADPSTVQANLDTVVDVASADSAQQNMYDGTSVEAEEEEEPAIIISGPYDIECSSTVQEVTVTDGKWKCHSCFKLYSTEFSLRRHVEGVHLKAYTCSRCRRSFFCKSKLKKHLELCNLPDKRRKSPRLQGFADQDQNRKILGGVDGENQSTSNLGYPASEQVVDKSRSSDWTSTPFPSRLVHQNNQDPEFSPISQSDRVTKANLDFSAISQNDSGFQMHNGDAQTANFSGHDTDPNPLQLHMLAAQSQVNNSSLSGVANTQQASIPEELIKHKQLTITKIQKRTTPEQDKQEDSESASDPLAVARTWVFLRTLQLARLRMMLQSQQEIKQGSVNENQEVVQNSSGHQDSDSGNGSNQNSDSEPKLEPEQQDQPDVSPRAVEERISENDTNRVSDVTPAEDTTVHRTKLYQCQDCQKYFSRKDGLLRHRAAIHLNIKYTCTECGLSFKSKYNLDDHSRGIHEKSQLFACTKCERTFELKVQLYRHTKKAHTTAAPKRWACSRCDKDFATKSGLDRHEENQH